MDNKGQIYNEIEYSYDYKRVFANDSSFGIK